MYEKDQLQLYCDNAFRAKDDPTFFLCISDYVNYVSGNKFLMLLVDDYILSPVRQYNKEFVRLDKRARKEIDEFVTEIKQFIADQKIQEQEVVGAISDYAHARDTEYVNSLWYSAGDILRAIIKAGYRKEMQKYLDEDQSYIFAPAAKEFIDLRHDVGNMLGRSAWSLWDNLVTIHNAMWHPLRSLEDLEAVGHDHEASKMLQIIEELEWIMDGVERRIDQIELVKRPKYEPYLMRFHARLLEYVYEFTDQLEKRKELESRPLPSLKDQAALIGEVEQNLLDDRLRCGDLELDLTSSTLRYKQSSITVSPTTQPVRLLIMLLKASPRYVGYEAIGKELRLQSYDEDMTKDDKMLFNDEIHKLRQSLIALLKKVKMKNKEIHAMLITVRGAGFKLINSS